MQTTPSGSGSVSQFRKVEQTLVLGGASVEVCIGHPRLRARGIRAARGPKDAKGVWTLDHEQGGRDEWPFARSQRLSSVRCFAPLVPCTAWTYRRAMFAEERRIPLLDM